MESSEAVGRPAGLRSGQASEPPQALGPHRSKEHREGEPGMWPPDPACVLNVASRPAPPAPQALRPRPSSSSSTQSSAQQGLGATCPPACHHGSCLLWPCLCSPRCQPLKCFPWFFFCPQDCPQSSATSSPPNLSLRITDPTLGEDRGSRETGSQPLGPCRVWVLHYE